MGAETKAILSKGTSPEAIIKALEAKYTNVTLIPSKLYDFYRISLDFIDIENTTESRRICVTPEASLPDYGIPGVLVSLGCWGQSVQILKHLCETFGGYLQENDYGESEFYSIREDLYLNNKELSTFEHFEAKLTILVGLDTASKVKELISDYLL